MRLNWLLLKLTWPPNLLLDVDERHKGLNCWKYSKNTENRRRNFQELNYLFDFVIFDLPRILQYLMLDTEKMIFYKSLETLSNLWFKLGFKYICLIFLKLKRIIFLSACLCTIKGQNVIKLLWWVFNIWKPAEQENN